MKEINYYLVLEKRPGDNIIIDINKLDITHYYVSNSISEIDTFTSMFTLDELKDSIIRSNMAKEEYRDSTIKIVSDAKHNLKPVTKDVLESIREFQNDNNEIDINMKNKMLGEYKKIVNKIHSDNDFSFRLIALFNNAINRYNDEVKEKSYINKKIIFNAIEELPYSYSRRIYIKIADELNKRKLDNTRKLEKANDIA